MREPRIMVSLSGDLLPRIQSLSEKQGGRSFASIVREALDKKLPALPTTKAGEAVAFRENQRESA